MGWIRTEWDGYVRPEGPQYNTQKAECDIELFERGVSPPAAGKRDREGESARVNPHYSSVPGPRLYRLSQALFCDVSALVVIQTLYIMNIIV